MINEHNNLGAGAEGAPETWIDAAAVRAALLAKQELVLIDVREEDSYAREHPLWAANFPLSRLELDAWRRIPRRDTRIAVYGAHDGEDLAPRAAQVLRALGYDNVFLLADGLDGWRRAGGELFRDVNVPSKAFGEWVEARCHTPSLPAADVRALLEGGAGVVVLDARRFDEYRTMSIPGAVSVPGAELVLRARALAPDPATRIIVNCAGRTRSIIGAQSLVNAGLPNPVAALRNGTIGWTLAGYALAHGAHAQAGEVDASVLAQASADARRVASRAGVARIGLSRLARWEREPGRTLYRFDVRSEAEYLAGHLPAFGWVSGGQLVQETDHYAPVRGARIVLADDHGVRADMTASWLAQMGWETYVLDPVAPAARSETGPWRAPVPEAPAVRTIAAAALAARQDEVASGDLVVLDVTASAHYATRHIPGARFALRSELRRLARTLNAPAGVVLTCGSGLLARFAARDLAQLVDRDVRVLDGGTAAWIAAGLPLEQGETHLASPRIDRYRRPYEGTDAPREAMQAYLDWEFGLVAQLDRDGTHGFDVLDAEPVVT